MLEDKKCDPKELRLHKEIKGREANMKRVVTTQVGTDGVLVLTLPLGEAEANRTVRVIVETSERPVEPFLTQEDWLEFIDATAGKWQGELERPAQGEYEKRDEWP